MEHDWIDDAIEQLRRGAEASAPQRSAPDDPRTRLVLSVLGWLCYAGAAAIAVLYTVKLLTD